MNREDLQIVCENPDRYTLYREDVESTTWFVDNKANLSLDIIKAEIVRDHMEMRIKGQVGETYSLEKVLQRLTDLELVCI